MRNGKPLGETQFRNMHAAYEDLPDELKHRLEGRTATHDFAKFWDMMVAKPGSTRKPLTPEQRAKKPPVSQPIFRRHPITGRACCMPMSATRCSSTAWTRWRAAQILDFLFRHQERAEYPPRASLVGGRRADVGQYRHRAQRVGDYTADEPRYMRRVQVMATLDYGAWRHEQ